MLPKGRPKGTKNKNTILAEELLERMKCNPLEVLCHVVNGNWKALGYADRYKGSLNGMQVENVTLDHRISAAKEAVKYLYPQKKAIEVSGNMGIEAKGFEVVIKDYTRKE